MDYQNRVGNKQGGGGLASSQETNAARRARVRELLSQGNNNFIETDPYVFRNHLGFLECKLCLTTHVSESSYLIHVQGKKHQTNLKKRQFQVEKANQQHQNQQDMINGISNIAKKSYIKIGTPAYQIKKIRHPVTEQLGLLVSCQFLRIAEEVKPMHRFMSYYEQKIDIIEKENDEVVNDFQYLIISAEPYQNIGIKIPNKPIVRSADDENEGAGLWDYWDSDIKTYYLQFFFRGL
ncbi:Prp11 protein [Saccharomycopsis crataegensis]|uniref:Prp11 protein n=1 Tax=Saccharomycopsis crataegensis TaxID=43959 RepID=A0AAV5QPY8_9ASCO|nr:Prp11 protein [Saccharomycopsis crataegensis]